MFTPNVKIGSRRGVWGNRVSPRPRPAGAWGNRVSPCPHPREGLGRLRPPKNKLIFIAALCGEAAWTAEVTHAPESADVPPSSRLRGQAARAPRRNVNTYPGNIGGPGCRLSPIVAHPAQARAVHAAAPRTDEMNTSSSWEGCAPPKPPASRGVGKPGFPTPLSNRSRDTYAHGVAPRLTAPAVTGMIRIQGVRKPLEQGACHARLRTDRGAQDRSYSHRPG